MGFSFDFSEFLNDKSKNLEGQEIVYISARDLRPSSNEYNFYHVDPESKTKMARSIELVGVQQPLIVKPADVKGKYDVLVGHTRRLAVMQLYEEGKRDDDLLPCIVDQSQDDALQELILIFTNSTQRERTDSEKMREVARLRVLLNEYKETHPDFSGNMQQIIADILGISKSKVGRLDNINNNLSDSLKKEFESGSINISTANELARLDKEGQTAMEKKMDKQGSLSMQEAKQAYADQLKKASETEEQEEKEEILENIKLHEEQPEKAEELTDEADIERRITVEDVQVISDVLDDVPTPEVSEVPADAESQLEQLAEYQKIGTIEECRKAMEKQRAKKLVKKVKWYKDGDHNFYINKYCCPFCGTLLAQESSRKRGFYSGTNDPYCVKCGQALEQRKVEG